MRTPLIAALVANLLFWPALFIFAALRPEYSHYTKAVSELGSTDAPRALAWNLIGYIIPGLLCAFAGWHIGKAADGRARILPGLLVASGLMLALAGVVPADMEHRTSVQTLIHLVGANGGLITWLAAMVMIAPRVRGSARAAAWIAIAALGLIVVFIVTSDPHRPGLTQRLLFADFFGSYLALALVRPAARGSA